MVLPTVYGSVRIWSCARVSGRMRAGIVLGDGFMVWEVVCSWSGKWGSTVKMLESRVL